MKTINIVSSDSNILNLKSILKRLLEWIVVSDVKSQKLRINLYAAILSCLRMLNGHFLENITSRNYETYVYRISLILRIGFNLNFILFHVIRMIIMIKYVIENIDR